MAKVVLVRNKSRGGRELLSARWCETFLCRLKGLTFRRHLTDGDGLILVESAESRINTAIHMFFMFMDLGVVWLDSDGRVVDTVRAKPWRIYAPKVPAKFVLECAPDLLEYLAVDDELIFEEIDH